MYLSILLFCFSWIILFTFKPKFVCEISKNKYLPRVNSKSNLILIFLYSCIIALIARVLIYFIKKFIACGN